MRWRSRRGSRLKSLAHDVHRRLAAGPQLEGAGSLREQDPPTVHRSQAEGTRLADKRRSAGDVYEINDRARGWERRRPQGHLTATSEGGGVDEQVRSVGDDVQSLVVPLDEMTGYIGVVGVPGGKGEVGTIQRDRGRPGSTTCAEDHNVGTARLDANLVHR